MIICLIVIASFVIFALDQTNTASKHQTEALSNGPAGSSQSGSSSQHESGLHKAIDEASNKLTSPFAGVISGSHSEWLVRGVKLLLALIVYGFGLGFVSRTLRIRA